MNERWILSRASSASMADFVKYLVYLLMWAALSVAHLIPLCEWGEGAPSSRGHSCTPAKLKQNFSPIQPFNKMPTCWLHPVRRLTAGQNPVCDPSGLTVNSYKGLAWQPCLWGRGFGEKWRAGEAALSTETWRTTNHALQQERPLCPDWAMLLCISAISAFPA